MKNNSELKTQSHLDLYYHKKGVCQMLENEKLFARFIHRSKVIYIFTSQKKITTHAILILSKEGFQNTKMSIFYKFISLFDY